MLPCQTPSCLSKPFPTPLNTLPSGVTPGPKLVNPWWFSNPVKTGKSLRIGWMINSPTLRGAALTIVCASISPNPSIINPSGPGKVLPIT